MRRQPYRVPEGGLIDRSTSLRFDFDDNRFEGYAGDSLASALLANGVQLVGRSFKYHRPRGIVALGADEPSALVGVGTGRMREPNLKAPQVELRDGLVAESQNCWPTRFFDLGRMTELASRFLPAGFYYKTFMWPASAWMTYERWIRRMAGLGVPPTGSDPDHYARRSIHVDVAVAGGGPAGIAAALAAARAGARVLLADEGSRFGGDLLHRPAEIDGQPALRWVEASMAELEAMPHVTVLPRATVSGAYDDNLLTVAERVTDHLGEPPFQLPRQRWWHVRARQAVFATGAYERPMVFRDNDRPGVMTVGAIRGYLHRYAVACGRRTILAGDNDTVHETARELLAARVPVVAVVDTRAAPSSEAGVAALAEICRQGVPVHMDAAIAGVTGGRSLGAEIVRLGADGRPRERLARYATDAVGTSVGWTPAVQLHMQARGTLTFDPERMIFLPETPGDANRSAGAAAGRFDLAGCLADGARAGAEAARDAGFGTGEPPPAPTAAGHGVGGASRIRIVEDGKPGKRFVDLQNDVTVDDVRLAEREGYRSVEHLKRYTTLGMGTDQGRLSNLTGLAILAEARRASIPEVGTTTFRPPTSPVTMSTVASGLTGELAQPVRRTAADEWHEERGGVMGDAAGWTRPQWYPVEGLSDEEAVADEVRRVREGVGLVDVSTLGKLDIRGPDAVELLERVYTNRWENVPVGRGRYGLMLREDGRVFDDGVTMRLGEDHFHMTTTTAHETAVYRHLERLLQVDWPDLRVYVTPVTDQWFAAAIAGPHARDLLARVVEDVDVSAGAMPMMSIREGRVAGVPARIMRISYSGELSYEINVAADYGLHLWSALLAAGAPLGLKVYGTEAMGVMRIEKGHVTHAEADGRTTPDDLGLGALAGKSRDFVGRRSLDLPALKAPDRKQLVGLIAVSANARFPFGGQVTESAGTGPMPSIGHVTSHAWSPTLGRHLGLALIVRGRERLGERLFVVSPVSDETVEVEVVSPVFHDPEGERQRA